MRLIRTKPGGIYVSTNHVVDLYTTASRIVITETNDQEVYSPGYRSKKTLEFAFNDLIRRLTEDHKLIEILTEEQAQAEIEKRRKK